jgi:ABC-2 type transport system permease protein
MRAAITIAAKDIRERLRDRSAILLAVVIPLGLAFVLNASLSGITEGEFHADVAVYDADGGEVAAGLRQVLDSEEAAGYLTVTTTSDEAAARVLVDGGDVSAAILIPDGFSGAVASNEAAELLVVGNPDFPIEAQVVGSIATGFTEEINAVRLSVTTVQAAAGAIDPAELPALIAAAQQQVRPVVLEGIEAEESGFDIATFFAMGIAVFFLFFTVQFGILSLVDERESGTMARLLAAPISRQSILVGKLLASFVIGVASTVVLWGATSLLMGADWGNWFGVLLLILVGVAAAMGLTAVVAMSAKTAEQAGALTAFIVVVLGMLGGVFFPITRTAGLLEFASKLTPHFWLMDGFQDLSAGAGVDTILPALGAVLLFAVVLGGVGLWRANSMVVDR